MKKWIGVVAIVAFSYSCNESATVKVGIDSLGKDADTLLKKIESSEVVDSIRSKGGKILDSVKSKGGRLIERTENKFNDLKKDSSSKSK